MDNMGMGFEFQMGMGMKSLKWEGFVTKNLFPHISSSQPWRHVLAAGSRSHASTCYCAVGRTDDVFEIRRASASVYSVACQ